jgi:hypothetical protein
MGATAIRPRRVVVEYGTYADRAGEILGLRSPARI